MAQETLQLAKYAAALRYDELPAQVIQRAKDTIADTIAAIAFGAHLRGAGSSSLRGSARRGAKPVFALGGARLQRRGRFANVALATPSRWTT